MVGENPRRNFSWFTRSFTTADVPISTNRYPVTYITCITYINGCFKILVYAMSMFLSQQMRLVAPDAAFATFFNDIWNTQE